MPAGPSAPHPGGLSSVLLTCHAIELSSVQVMRERESPRQKPPNCQPHMPSLETCAVSHTLALEQGGRGLYRGVNPGRVTITASHPKSVKASCHTLWSPWTPGLVSSTLGGWQLFPGCPSLLRRPEMLCRQEDGGITGLALAASSLSGIVAHATHFPCLRTVVLYVFVLFCLFQEGT